MVVGFVEDRSGGLVSEPVFPRGVSRLSAPFSRSQVRVHGYHEPRPRREGATTLGESLVARPERLCCCVPGTHNRSLLPVSWGKLPRVMTVRCQIVPA